VSAIPTATPATSSTPEAHAASSTPTIPWAMGRARFPGWSRSASTSRRSFSKYVPEDARQNATNATSVRAATCAWNS